MEREGAVNASEARPGSAPGPDRRALALLLLCGAVLFLWRLGAHDLWPPDEPRFGLVAREMRERGDAVVLSLNDALYTDKPPLFFWAINGFALLRGGVDEWAARLPSAASGILSLFLILRLGTRIYDRRTGLLAALVFATAPQIVERARWASIDMTLNLLVLGAILCLWRAPERPEASTSAHRLAWILMGLATLAKGPVGALLPLLAILPVLLLERDLRAVRRLFLPSGVLLYLAVVLAWLVPWALRVGPREALGIVWHQNAERYVHAWNNQQPVWYYLWRFPAGFLPWILFLPAAVAQAFSPEERERRPAAVFLVGWIAAILLFFSFSTGKRGVYIIPLYPAASLLVGRLLERAAARDGENDDPAGAVPGARARRRCRAPLVLWAGMAAILAASLPFVVRRRAPDLVPAAAALGGLLLAGAILALPSARRGRRMGAAAPLVGSLVAAILLVVAAVLPWVDRYENLRGFAEQVRARLQPEIRFGTTEQKREAWVFYTGRFAEDLDTDAGVIDYLSRPGTRDLVIEDRRLGELRDRLPGGLAVLVRGRVAGQDYDLLRTTPSP